MESGVSLHPSNNARQIPQLLEIIPNQALLDSLRAARCRRRARLREASRRRSKSTSVVPRLVTRGGSVRRRARSIARSRYPRPGPARGAAPPFDRLRLDTVGPVFHSVPRDQPPLRPDRRVASPKLPSHKSTSRELMTMVSVRGIHTCRACYAKFFPFTFQGGRLWVVHQRVLMSTWIGSSVLKATKPAA